jgi:DNA-binding NarL/FixJ family response regulator
VDHQEALAKIRELNPDLVTVDLNLKNSHGLELIKDMHVQFPALLVLVVSVHDEFLNARRIISAGAHGYISKLEPLTHVLTALERIFAGELYASDQFTSQIALQLARSKCDHHAPPQTLRSALILQKVVNYFSGILSGLYASDHQERNSAQAPACRQQRSLHPRGTRGRRGDGPAL